MPGVFQLTGRWPSQPCSSSPCAATQRPFSGRAVGEDEGRDYGEAQHVDGVDAGEACGGVTKQAPAGPLRGGVAARENEAGEHEERGDCQVASADQRMQCRREGKRSGSEHLARAGKVVEDDPQGQHKAQAGERGQVGGHRSRGRGRGLSFEGDSLILPALEKWSAFSATISLVRSLWYDLDMFKGLEHTAIASPDPRKLRNGTWIISISSSIMNTPATFS